jgi:hypothetical protein
MPKDLISKDLISLIKFIYAHNLNKSELNDDEYLTSLINNYYENL